MAQGPSRLLVPIGFLLSLSVSFSASGGLGGGAGVGLSAEPGSHGEPLTQRLEAHVRILAEAIGERNAAAYVALEQAADYIQAEWKAAGYAVESQDYRVGDRVFRNLVASRSGRTQQEDVILLGAHYDTVLGSPGADDNASGVAVLIELARLAATDTFSKTVRFVAFSTEEPPFFRTERMGSHIYARRARAEGTRLAGMISLEMVGYYVEREGSQSYPPLFRFFYPSTGNFVALVSDFRSRRWTHQVESALTQSMTLPVESVTTFRFIPGVDWSDHRSFWQEGYPALMLTDTAFYRYPHYHQETDTPEKLDYRRMAELTRGLLGMLHLLAP